MEPLRRNSVHVRGTGDRAMVFAHGFGCDQYSWRHIAPAFERDFVTVLFDHVGCGSSQLPCYSAARYSNLSAYGDDLAEIGQALNLKHAVLVGHSFGAMVGALASIREPEMFDQLVLIAPNARYINDADYVGGFSASQMKAMLRFIETDYGAWSRRVAPLLMNNPERPELACELAESFGRQDPAVASDLARVIFHADLRHMLSQLNIQSLILQSQRDLLTPREASHHVHKNIAGSEMSTLEARGHMPQVCAPLDTVTAISRFLKRSAGPRSQTNTSSVVRSLVATGTQTLGIANGPTKTDAHTHDDMALEYLLSRTGELWMHIGRYDMYAFSLQSLLVPDHTLKTDRFTLRSRGEDIRRRLAPLSKDLTAHFTDTDSEMGDLLDRLIPAASYGAAIPGANPRYLARQSRTERSWFDQANGSADDWARQSDRMERDILRVVALCFRIVHCVLGVQRLLQQEEELQDRALSLNPGHPRRK